MNSETLIKSILSWIQEYLSNEKLDQQQIDFVIDNVFIDNNPKFYIYYPFVFAQIVNYEDSDRLIKLSAAGFLCYRAVIISDAIMDNNKKVNVDINKYIEIYNICQEKSFKILMELFPNNSVFWTYWDLRRSEFHKNLELSSKLFNSNEVTFDEFAVLSDCKSAIGKIAIDAISILSNCSKNLYDKMLVCHKLFYSGFQIHDDISDVIEDYAANSFNIAVYNLKKSSYCSLIEASDILVKAIHLSGVSIKLYKKSTTLFKRSLNKVDNNNNLWYEIVNKFIYVSNLKLKTISDYNTIVRYKSKIPVKLKYYQLKFADNNSFDIYSKSLNNIIAEYNNGCLDLLHIMTFDKSDNLKSKRLIHHGDVFQRAILADCLLELSNKLNFDCSSIIKDELKYLVSKRDKQQCGGWSYLPSCIDISADADDLGQILQLFSNYYNGKIPAKLFNDYFKIPIDVLISDNINSDGSINTWIIPKDNKNDVYRVRDSHNLTKWGVGPHLDVVANFLFGLRLTNLSDYTEVITNGLRYVEACQHSDGYWESRWYYGKYYGTYISTRLFSCVNNLYDCSSTLSKAKRFLLNSQNSDFGWGEVKSDPLSTAFAILALVSIEPMVPLQEVKNARKYLWSTIDNDGFWKAEKFIKPRKGSYFSSKTLTTALVLKALVD